MSAQRGDFDAAVPGPRFRDQLAATLSTTTTCHGEEWPSEFHYQQIDRLMPLIAAEVDARVQAAANQRAVEALQWAAEGIETSWKYDCAGLRNPDTCESCRVYTDALTEVRSRATALAQPAGGES